MKAVNLLPSDLRGAGKPASAGVASGDEATGRAGAFALLGALGFCVVALAAYVLVGNTVKDRRAELDQVTAQATAVTQRAAKLKPYADFAAKAQERVQTVKDLAASRFDWEQALRDISRVVPAGVTLSQLDGSISSDSGAGGSGLRSAIAAPAVDLQGCTTGGQVAVARLLSRLRNVDGVTRVSLSKSDKPDAATASTAGSGPATGCGVGRAPQFEIVVFFERSRVPATLDDVSVGGSSASATATTAAATPTTAAATPTPSSSTTTTP